MTATTLHILPDLCFHPGQRVIERIGDGAPDRPPTHQTREVELVHIEGRKVVTEDGNGYDMLTGAADPKGKVYRSIRSMTADDRRKATNLLGGTEASP